MFFHRSCTQFAGEHQNTNRHLSKRKSNRHRNQKSQNQLGPADSGFFGYDDDYFSAYLNDGSYFDAPQQIEYSYDGKTLTVPSQELRDYRDSTLTIGGTLSHSTIDVPANTPTKIFVGVLAGTSIVEWESVPPIVRVESL